MAVKKGVEEEGREKGKNVREFEGVVPRKQVSSRLKFEIVYSPLALPYLTNVGGTREREDQSKKVRQPILDHA